MSTTKVSVTLPTDALEQAREAAGSGELSAYIADALVRKLQRERIRKLLDEMDEEFGLIPEADYETVLAEWRSLTS